MIGILGGIGSGKSSVIRGVQGWRFRIIDADRIGHDLLKMPSIIQRLEAAFGSTIVDDGQIHRSRLAELVFADTQQSQQALETLNSILHPEIRTEILKQIRSAGKDVDAVILDAALLLEGGWAEHCHHLIFIETPDRIRQQRVIQNRGWDHDELEQREARQMPVAEKKAKADFVVDNSGSLQMASSEMEAILASILDP